VNELDTSLALQLDRYAVVDVPREWEDVLRRAGVRRRGRASLAVAAVATGLVLASAPALGVDDGLRTLLDRDRPVVRLSAPLVGPNGLSGRFQLEAPGVLVVEPRGRRRVLPVIPRGRVPRGGRLPQATFWWTLTFRGADTATRAVLLRRGRVVQTLCAPCRSGASAELHARMFQAVPLFNGLTSVRVDTSDGVLRGRIRFLPRR
jgi:hypothetical protein